jgi:hypothetical protein
MSLPDRRAYRANSDSVFKGGRAGPWRIFNPVTCMSGGWQALQNCNQFKTTISEARSSLLEQVNSAGTAQPDYVGHADLRVFYLACSGFAAQVLGNLVNVGDTGCS